jgi:L-arabinokinase
MKTIVFYISGHGFGHAARDIEVINALLARRDDVRIAIRTSAARWLFELTVAGNVDLQPVETDTGIVQIDSLHLDARDTVRSAREFMRSFSGRVQQEADFLAAAGASLVVADIPPLGIAAARQAGVAVAAMSNFTWDWIYSAYDDTEALVTETRAVYALADIALRLPMHGGFHSMRHIVDLPFVARRSAREPAETRNALGWPADERLVLASFGGYGLAGLDLDALSQLEGYGVLVSGSVPLADLPNGLRGGRRGSLLPFDECAMYAAGFRYEDVVRAVDIVVTKPGYGIISECVANETAMLYTARGHFIEYDVLVRDMPQFVRCRFIGHPDLFAGTWGPHLDALLAQPQPPLQPAVNGADVAASILLNMIGE